MKAMSLMSWPAAGRRRRYLRGMVVHFTAYGVGPTIGRVSTVPLPHVDVPEIDWARVLQVVKQSRRIPSPQIAAATGISIARIDQLLHGRPALYREGVALLELLQRVDGRLDYVQRSAE
jgi:hypothetical protein